MSKPTSKESGEKAGPPLAKSMSALAAVSAARVVVATASIEQPDGWEANITSQKLASERKMQSLNNGDPRRSNRKAPPSPAADGDNGAEKMDAWTFIRTSKTPTPCKCDDEKCRRANSAEEPTARRVGEDEPQRSFSPLRLFGRRSRGGAACKPPVATGKDNSSQAGEEGEDVCRVEGCFLHSPQSPPAATANAPSSGASSTSSLPAAAPAGEARKWRASLKFKAFRNARQQTFHSLDMYGSGQPAAGGGDLPSDVDGALLLSALDKCGSRARRTDSIPGANEDNSDSASTRALDTLPIKQLRVQSCSLCNSSKGRAAKYSAPADASTQNLP